MASKKTHLPKRISNYKIIQKIGDGAMGTVYKAENIHNHKIVALKVLNSQFKNDDRLLSRFLCEARNVAKLKKHPNLIEAYDFGEAGGYYYFAMNYVEGHPLALILLAKGKMRENTALHITQKINSALLHLYQNNLIHRDIKPENILIGVDGGVKLCDLGLSLTTEQASSSRHEKVGTVDYYSPEQVRGKHLDIRSDIYSLGITLYYMLVGELPFAGSSREIQQQHLQTELPLKNLFLAEVSENTVRLVKKMTAKKPKHRPQDPEQLFHDLSKIFEAQVDKKQTTQEFFVAWKNEKYDQKVEALEQPMPNFQLRKKKVTMSQYSNFKWLVILGIIALFLKILKIF